MRHGNMRHGNMETWRPGHMDTWTHLHGDKIKRETEAQAISLICSPFAHHANRSLSFVRFHVLSVMF
jgi:hypothetical protein